MLAILYAHAVAALVAPVLVRRWGRRAFYALALVPLGSLPWVALNWPGRGEQTVQLDWVPELSMNITFRFDALAAIMSVLVLAVGALVLFYCAEYFHHHDGHTERRLPSFAAELVAFSGAMFGLVVSDNMLMLYLFWELTTVLSFLLVGHYAERATSRRAATQALLVTTAGGLAMLVGIVILGEPVRARIGCPNSSPHRRRARPPAVGVVLILIGALSKSAIVPMHFWLPGAMAAPTPVSAYLHAAAMVKAGVYLVARLTPGFADSPGWRPIIVTLGLVTMLLAGWRAVREYDLKLILAFGTVSQLGLIILMVGSGGGDMMLAGLAMLCAHAMFKAALFMVVGIIDHSTGTRDIRTAGLARRPTPSAAGHRHRRHRQHGGTATLPRLRRQGGGPRPRSPTAASLGAAAPWVLAGVAFGSVFTTIYSLRFLYGAFARKGRARPSQRVAEMHRPPNDLPRRPGDTRRAAGLVFGIWPAGLDHVLDEYADTVPGRCRLPPRTVARGEPAAAAVGPGARRRHRRLLRAGTGCGAPGWRYLPLGNADRIYDAVIRGTDVFAVRLTALTQRGSIPATQAVILSTLVLLPTVDAGARRARPSRTRAVGLASAGGRRPDHPGRGAQRDDAAQPSRGGAARRRDGLRLRRDLRLPRRTRPRAHPVPGGDADVGDLRPGAADAARGGGSGQHHPPSACRASRWPWRSAPASPRSRRSRWPRGPPRRSPTCYPTPPTTAGRAPTPSTCCWSTSARGTPWARSRCCWWPRPAWRQWCSATGASARPPASAGRRAAGHRQHPRPADEPRRRRHHLAARQRTPRPPIPLAGARGRDADHLPAHHGAVVLLLLRRPQHPGRRLRRRADRGPGAGAALPGRWSIRARRGAARRRGQAAGRGPGPVGGDGGHVAAAGAPVLSSAVIELDLPVLGHIKLVTALFFDLGVYLIVVGLVLDVLRSLGARVDVEMVQAAQQAAPPMTSYLVPLDPDRRPHQRRGVPAARTQPDPNAVGTVAGRQRA